MSKNKKFAKELEERTKKFAVSIIKLASKLPKTSIGSVISSQLVKSGTSIGANYREANRAVSLPDFKNKISICEKEASETQYWLQIVMEIQLLSLNEIQDNYNECSELLALFTTIGFKKDSGI